MPSLDELYAELLEMAMKDGVISDKEKKILDTIKIEGREYDDYLKKSKEDGIIDEEELTKLSDLKYKLLQKSFHSAVENRKVAEDAEKLLTLLVKIFNESI
ncbi:MAG: hypothetical protein INQ03_00575 [Candidatus Heimdallarchaeota archaeon]|nr:hypothetical protein [Candidatus Heimdallarchaeota archaeon]